MSKYVHPHLSNFLIISYQSQIFIKYYTEVVYHIIFIVIIVQQQFIYDVSHTHTYSRDFANKWKYRYLPFIFCLLKYRAQVSSSTFWTYDFIHISIHIIAENGTWVSVCSQSKNRWKALLVCSKSFIYQNNTIIINCVKPPLRW